MKGSDPESKDISLLLYHDRQQVQVRSRFSDTRRLRVGGHCGCFLDGRGGYPVAYRFVRTLPVLLLPEEGSRVREQTNRGTVGRGPDTVMLRSTPGIYSSHLCVPTRGLICLMSLPGQEVRTYDQETENSSVSRVVLDLG